MRNIKKLIIKRILQAPADGARMHVRNCLGLGAVNPGRAGFPSTTQAGDLVAGSHLPEPGPLGPQNGGGEAPPSDAGGRVQQGLFKKPEGQGTRLENMKCYRPLGTHFPESFTASRLGIAP